MVGDNMAIGGVFYLISGEDSDRELEGVSERGRQGRVWIVSPSLALYSSSRRTVPSDQDAGILDTKNIHRRSHVYAVLQLCPYLGNI